MNFITKIKTFITEVAIFCVVFIAVVLMGGKEQV